VSAYTVLAETGETLINVIWEAIQNDPDLVALINSKNLITLDPPKDDPANNQTPLLSIYLYRIVEDPYMKNQWAAEGTGGRLRRPPLTLDLFYMITPLLKAPRDQQMVLGKIMQILYDRPALEGSELTGSLRDSGDRMRVVFNPVTLEEAARVWQALETAYRLSACYMVRVAMVDSTFEQAQQPTIERRAAFNRMEATS
jgi:hypothetical protein